MKYSLRSLMVVAILALPFLAYSLAAVWTYMYMVAHYNWPRIQVLRT